MKKFKLSTAKLKKAGKELQVILEPTENDGKTPLIIASGTDDEMIAKIIEGGNALTSDDSISDHLTKVLETVKAKVSKEEETNENDTIIEPKVMTWDDINSMKKKDLKKLCKEKKLITESDDYDKIKDYQIEVAIELEIEVPEDNDNGSTKTDKEPEKDKKDERSLIEIVQDTKKLADLKELVENDDHFKKLRKGLKEYKGLSGPKKLKPKMLEILGVEVEKPIKNVKKLVKESGKEKVKFKSKEKRGKVQKDKPVKKISKCGYVASLVKKGKYTLQEIIDKSVKEMGCSVGSVRTMINHGKNPKFNIKYKPFNKRLIIIEKDKVKFK